MITYNVIMRGEDGMEFCIEQLAASKRQCEICVEDMYPESTIIEIMSPNDVRDRQMNVYQDAQRMYDEDYYYDN
jgi:hypothetical protein